MASEQGTLEVPPQQVEEVKPQEETPTEVAPPVEPETTEAAPPAAPPAEPETTEAAPPAAPPAEPETTTPVDDAPPAKVSTKEKITNKVHQTGDKIKGTVASLKEKVTPSKS